MALREYDMPPGRIPESYRFRIEETFDGYVTDTIWTDDLNEARRVANAMAEEEYAPRIVRQTD